MDVFDHEGRSALHLAADNGSIEVCEALLNKNAFINSKAKTGKETFYSRETQKGGFVYKSLSWKSAVLNFVGTLILMKQLFSQDHATFGNL